MSKVLRNFVRGYCRGSMPAAAEHVVPASVYFHWPFCRKRCNYCNFNKYVPGRRGQNMEHVRMTEAMVAEAATLMEIAGVTEVTSVFFGGGTPSLMKPDTVETLLSKVLKARKGVEVTLEANPSDLAEDPGLLKAFVDAGVNRISLGLQAFSERDLHFMNRDHSVEQGFAALDSCLLALPDATSADLIFGRPGQTVAEWVAELEFLITHYPLLGHVSLYELTLERGTQLWTDVEKGSVQMPDEDVVADMYDVAVATLDSNGLKRYEVCNFARSFDQESAHNKWYWDGGEYVGVGPGAHGRFRPKIDSHHATSQTAIDYLKSQLKSGIIASGVGNKTEFRQARVQTLDPSGWLKEVAVAGHGTRRISCLSHAAAAEELLATSLRTSRGLTVERWAAVEPPCDLERLVGASDACLEFVESGTLVVDESGIRLSGEGLKLADHVVPFLMASLDDATQSMDLSIPKL